MHRCGVLIINLFLLQDPFEAFVIFSIRHEIRRIDLHKRDYSLLVPGLRNTIALDFHFNRSLLYWTDVVEDKIYRGKLSETGGNEHPNWCPIPSRPLFNLSFSLSRYSVSQFLVRRSRPQNSNAIQYALCVQWLFEWSRKPLNTLVLKTILKAALSTHLSLSLRGAGPQCSYCSLLLLESHKALHSWE